VGEKSHVSEGEGHSDMPEMEADTDLAEDAGKSATGNLMVQAERNIAVMAEEVRHTSKTGLADWVVVGEGMVQTKTGWTTGDHKIPVVVLATGMREDATDRPEQEEQRYKPKGSKDIHPTNRMKSWEPMEEVVENSASKLGLAEVGMPNPHMVVVAEEEPKRDYKAKSTHKNVHHSLQGSYLPSGSQDP
jgi:hypothetical protein